MNISTRRIFFGAALILLGGLFLFQQLFHLQFHVGAIIVAMVFALAGLGFLYVMSSKRDNWWAAIPGMVLLGLGVLIAASEFYPHFANQFGGSLFLGFIGLAFLVVLLLRHEAWWAVIPAGVLFTLALVAGVTQFLENGLVSGAIFFRDWLDLCGCRLDASGSQRKMALDSIRNLPGDGYFVDDWFRCIGQFSFWPHLAGDSRSGRRIFDRARFASEGFIGR